MAFLYGGKSALHRINMQNMWGQCETCLPNDVEYPPHKSSWKESKPSCDVRLLYKNLEQTDFRRMPRFCSPKAPASSRSFRLHLWQRTKGSSPRYRVQSLPFGICGSKLGRNILRQNGMSIFTWQPLADTSSVYFAGHSVSSADGRVANCAMLNPA